VSLQQGLVTGPHRNSTYDAHVYVRVIVSVNEAVWCVCVCVCVCVCAIKYELVRVCVSSMRIFLP